MSSNMKYIEQWDDTIMSKWIDRPFPEVDSTIDPVEVD
jgi:hypothetical protein